MSNVAIDDWFQPMIIERIKLTQSEALSVVISHWQAVPRLREKADHSMDIRVVTDADRAWETEPTREARDILFILAIVTHQDIRRPSHSKFYHLCEPPTFGVNKMKDCIVQPLLYNQNGRSNISPISYPLGENASFNNLNKMSEF